MGSMIVEEHISILFELLRCVPYIKEEKANIKRFISGLSVALKDMIEFDEPRLLEEAVRKLKHCYEQSQRKKKSWHGWKGKDKTKGKWPPK